MKSQINLIIILGLISFCFFKNTNLKLKISLENVMVNSFSSKNDTKIHDHKILGEKIVRYAHLAMAVYNIQKLEKSKTWKLAGKTKTITKDTSVLGLVAVSEKHKKIVAALRGENPTPEESKNLINHYTAFRDGYSCKDCLVHKDSNSKYNLLEKDLDSILQDAIKAHQGFKVIVVGHGIGGVMATIFANHISDKDKNLELYTYGCPRAGNVEFKRFTEKNIKHIHRVVFDRDPFQFVPKKEDSYRHIGKKVVFLNKGEFAVRGEEDADDSSPLGVLYLPQHFKYSELTSKGPKAPNANLGKFMKLVNEKKGDKKY